MGICIACKGLLESDILGKCHANTVDKCTTYGQNGECLKCQNTFTLADGKCVKSFTGCVNEGGTGECYECGFGRMRDGTNCKGTINCATYQETCTKCADGYKL